MPYYETVFIARQDLSDAQVKAITDSITDYIASQKGTVNKTENWGLRTLAYRINKNRKGHYVLIEYSVAPAAIAEMERQLRMNEDVLRFVTIKIEEFAKEASAVLRNTGTEESRGPRSDRSDQGYRGARKPLVQEAA